MLIRIDYLVILLCKVVSQSEFTVHFRIDFENIDSESLLFLTALNSCQERLQKERKRMYCFRVDR